MTRGYITDLLVQAQREVTSAKREPGHSPTEDRLIDACDSLIQAMVMLLEEAASR